VEEARFALGDPQRVAPSLHGLAAEDWGLLVVMPQVSQTPPIVWMQVASRQRCKFNAFWAIFRENSVGRTMR
jgi:hypothetical protein